MCYLDMLILLFDGGTLCVVLLRTVKIELPRRLVSKRQRSFLEIHDIRSGKATLRLFARSRL